jgi:MFS family permease
VPRELLTPANALIGGTASAGSVVAPAIAGLVVATLGTGAAFALQASVLVIALGCLAAVRIPVRPSAHATRPAIGRQLRIGWAEFAQRRWLWLPTLEWTVFSLVILAPMNVLGPVIAQRYLGGASAWGVIGSCLSLGAVAGQIVAGRARLPARPAVARTTPTGSSRPAPERLSRASSSGSTTMPMGTLIQKIHCRCRAPARKRRCPR